MTKQTQQGAQGIPPLVMAPGEFMDFLDDCRAQGKVTFKEHSKPKNTTGASYSPLREAEKVTSKPYTAAGMLQEGAKAMIDRANERDREGGERSMKACVEAFNALTGRLLSEEEGWLFMAVLKMSRSRGGNFRADDFIDGAAYMALAGEAAAKGVKL